MKSILTVYSEGEASKPYARRVKRPLVVCLQKAFEGVGLSQMEKRGSQTCMYIHVLVLLLHISMDSIAFSVWEKEALCSLHHHGNLQNQ